MLSASLSLFRGRWWIWLLLTILIFAPIMAIPAFHLDPLSNKVIAALLASLVGIFPSLYGIAQYRSQTIRSVLSGNFGALIAVVIATTLLNLFVWKFVELPVLGLVATPGELTVYGGDFSSADLARPRAWVDAIHSCIVFLFASPLLIAPLIVLLRKLNAAEALSMAIHAFLANWRIFVAIALAMTALHAFVDTPSWLFALQAILFLFVVTPIFTLFSILMADQMVTQSL